MTRDKVKIRLDELGNALGRLREILGVPDDHTGRVDATIQRFEFCYELSWKAIKAALEIYGHETASPKQAFQKAFAMRWIDDEKLWSDMLEMRNITSHTYKEEKAIEVSEQVPRCLKEMERVYKLLNNLMTEGNKK